MQIKNSTIHEIATAHGILEYCRFGSGNPLFLIMGYATTMNGWDRRFLSKLTNHHEVIVFNNRNTGKYMFSGEYSLVNLASDIEALRQHLGYSAIALGGISMGGMLAQNYAHLYPQRISHLIIINSTPPGNLITRPSEQVINLLRSMDKFKLSIYWKFVQLLIPSLLYIPIVEFYHFKPKNNTKLIPPETIRQQQNIIEEWSELPNPTLVLDGIKIPTLVLSGDADKLIPPENSKTINKYVRNSKLVTFEQGGHVMIYQYPAKIADTIIDFLRH